MLCLGWQRMFPAFKGNSYACDQENEPGKEYTHTVQMNPFKPRNIRMLERTVKATHRKPSVFTCYTSYLVVEFPGLQKVLLLTVLLQTPEKMHTQPLRLISKALLLHLPGNRRDSAGRTDRGPSQGVGQICQLNLSNG